jgi:hypothetical protein
MVWVVGACTTVEAANSPTELTDDAIVQAAMTHPVMFGCEVMSFRTGTLLRLKAFG